MSKEIIKKGLQIIGTQIIEVPINSKFLTAENIDGKLVLFFLADPKNKIIEYYVNLQDGDHTSVYGNDNKYINTVKLANDYIVHVFIKRVT